MIETAIALGLLAALALATSLGPESGLTVGLWLVVIGLALGLPTGWRYHVMLARTLGRRGELPHGWWWEPTAHHPKLTDDERVAVMPWFVGGAVGFSVAMLGCAVGITAVVRLLV